MKRLTVIAMSIVLSVMPSGVAHAAKKSGLCPQWRKLALSVGWRTQHLSTLDRLMHRESRCRPGALNSTLNRDGSWDYGLMQINNKTWCLVSKNLTYPMKDSSCSKMRDLIQRLNVESSSFRGNL